MWANVDEDVAKNATNYENTSWDHNGPTAKTDSRKIVLPVY